MKNRNTLKVTMTAILAMMAATISLHAIGALGPQLVHDFAISRTQFGLLATAHFTVAAVTSLHIGRIADAVGSRLALLAIFAIAAGTLTGVAWSQSYLMVVVFLSIGGLIQAASNPVTNIAVVRLVPAGRRGLVVGLKQSGVQLAAFVAGSALVLAASITGWRLALQLLVLIPVAGIAFLFASIPRGGKSPSMPVRNHKYGLPVRSKPRTAIYVYSMASAMAAAIVCIPMYGSDALQLTAHSAGFALGLMGFFGTVARISWGFLVDRVDRPFLILRFLSLGTLAALVVIASADFVHEGALYVGAALLGVSGMAWSVVVMASITKNNNTYAGSGTGFVSLFFFAGYITMPLFFGQLVDWSGGYMYAWAIVAACPALATLSTVRIESLTLQREHGSAR